MATFLDVTILGGFSLIFPFLLVFVALYAVLINTKPFGGEKKGIYALISFCIAVLVLFSKTAIALVETMIPWFVVFFIVILLTMMAFTFLGAKESDMISALKSHGTLKNWLVTIAIAIVIISFAQVLGQPLLEKGKGGGTVESPQGPTSTGSFSENLGNTLFHPKVLGFAFIILLSTFTIFFLSKGENIK
ncbi:hypothetical protein D6745_02785 [Candidatus Woesearchaeota archaeon]|nr:MAG: hypothetical protein D6745_02785 [Candidatus Woesearchaeota archaeon]